MIIGASILSSFYGLIQLSYQCGGIGSLCAQLMNRISASTHPLAIQLYQAQQEKNPDHFINLLKQAATTMSKNEFTRFLETRSPDLGWTALHIAAITDDTVQMTALFHALNVAYKNDKQAIAHYLNLTTKKGYTAFMLSCYSGNIRIVKTFFDNAIQTLKNNKKLLLQTLNAAEPLKGIVGLHLLAFDSASASIEYVLKTLEKLWGNESKEFYEFINKTDNNGLTVLNYSRVTRDKHLLINYGAIINRQRSPGIRQAEQASRKLKQAMHNNDLQEVLHILHEAKTTFNEEEYIHFMTTQDKQGWVPIMNPTGQNRIKLVEILLSEVYENLKHKPYDLYDVIAAMDFTGRTTLAVAVERRAFEIATMLLTQALEVPINKYLLYDYLVTQEAGRGFAVLTIAIFDSSDEDIYIDFVEQLLEGIAQLFGKESRAFYLFINQLDYNNYTAFDYANTPKMKELLMKYGAQPGSIVYRQQQQELKKATNF